MKIFTRPLLVALALAALAASAPARGQDAWAAFSPDGEEFAVLMPSAPTATAQQLRAGELKAEGRRYEAKGDDGATYLVLSLRDAEGANERLTDGGATLSFHRASPYLDAIAELSWEVLVSPEIKKLRKPWAVHPSIFFRREFELGGRPAREYLIKLEKGFGPVYVCADGPRIYVVAAFGKERSAGLQRFVDSFALGTQTPAAPAPAETKADSDDATGVGPGPEYDGYAGDGSGPVDYSRPFKAGELTRRAQVMSRPEPSYTAGARKFWVKGTVTVRAVLAATGEVERVVILTRLPHGLTGAAVEAARKIRFAPAEKDGRKVSQWVTIQYNFDIY